MSIRHWKTRAQTSVAASVVVAIYNKPRELQFCLEGYLRQSQKNFELILADDGSHPDIEALCRRYAAKMQNPVTYLFQPDHGWGKLRMLNLAILLSRANHMIFTDGDCVPHRHFVRGHIENFAENAVLCGRRTEYMEGLSPTLKLEDFTSGRFENPLWLLRQNAKGEVDFVEHGLYFPQILGKFIRLFAKNAQPTIVGCNFSLHKKWLLEINGFDETFSKPGLGEDTDVDRRLKKLNLEWKWVSYRALQYHIWHPLTIISDESKTNYARLKAQDNPHAERGIAEAQREIATAL